MAWTATLSYIHVGIPIAIYNSVIHISEIILTFIWKFKVVVPDSLGRNEMQKYHGKYI
jgi:flagellar biosynthesis protein FliQ